MTAIQVTELSLDLNAAVEGPQKNAQAKLNKDQELFCAMARDWLRNPNGLKMMTLRGRPGTGKTFTVNEFVRRAKSQGLIAGEVWACGPTHQSVKVLKEACKGAPISTFLTAHSLFGLRPEKVKFELHHEDALNQLIARDESSYSPDDRAELAALQWRKQAAIEERKEFVAHRPKQGVENIELLIVDEISMVDEALYSLYVELIHNSDMNPNLRVLGLGDSMQLPPIGEELSKMFLAPSFLELTHSERNSGNITAYTDELREFEDPQDARIRSLHYKYADDESFFIMPQTELMRQLKDVMDGGDSVRFLAGTNKEVREINELVRFVLKGSDALKYDSGDVVLSLSAIQRKSHHLYDVRCDGDIQDTTSTLYELGERLGVGDYVKCGDDGGTRLTARAFSHVSPFGTTFEREFYRYRYFDSNDDWSKNVALALLNPAQYEQWLEECEKAWVRARTTATTSSKEPRGKGKAAKMVSEVWDQFGLKNWRTKKDGSPLSNSEYKKIRTNLWADAFNLSQFSDKFSFSYCSTVNRAQGISVDVAIVSEKSIIKSSIGEFSETFKLRNLVLTAASRARKQLIIMV